MGFYVMPSAISPHPDTVATPRLRRQVKPGTPPEKSRLEFFSSSRSRAGFFASQPVEPHQENEPTPTIIVSGISCWLSRDPIEEWGGENLYAFVINDPVDLLDPLGLDFIAVGIRPAKAALGLQDHMAIEFYEEKPPCTKKGYKFKSSEVGKAPLENAKRTGQFELIPTFSDYEHKYSKTVLGKTINWSLPARVSFIYRTSTANDLVVIYDDSAGDAAAKWKQIVAAALGYKYAEQLPIGNPLKNWPNSKYQLPPGNNSNTFIHEMASAIGASAAVFSSTPGATKASPVTDTGPVPVYKTTP